VTDRMIRIPPLERGLDDGGAARLREASRELNREILNETFETKLVFVRRKIDGRPVTVFLEHGDGEGASMAAEFVEDCEGLVQPGDLYIDKTEILI